MLRSDSRTLSLLARSWITPAGEAMEHSKRQIPVPDVGRIAVVLKGLAVAKQRVRRRHAIPEADTGKACAVA